MKYEGGVREHRCVATFGLIVSWRPLALPRNVEARAARCGPSSPQSSSRQGDHEGLVRGKEEGRSQAGRAMKRLTRQRSQGKRTTDHVYQALLAVSEAIVSH